MWQPSHKSTIRVVHELLRLPVSACPTLQVRANVSALLFRRPSSVRPAAVAAPSTRRQRRCCRPAVYRSVYLHVARRLRWPTGGPRASRPLILPDLLQHLGAAAGATAEVAATGSSAALSVQMRRWEGERERVGRYHAASDE